MLEFLEFLGRHWLLASLFSLSLIWLFAEEAFHQGMGGARKSLAAVTELLNRENALILDIRELQAFKEGHITGALNLPWKQWDQPGKKLPASGDRPVVVVCAVGQHSVLAMHRLKKAGHTKVYLLQGGMQAWKAAYLPLVKS